MPPVRPMIDAHGSHRFYELGSSLSYPALPRLRIGPEGGHMSSILGPQRRDAAGAELGEG